MSAADLRERVAYMRRDFDLSTFQRSRYWAEECRGIVEAMLAAPPRPQASPQAEPVCKCDLRTRLVGDGCAVCNPELARELAEKAAPQPQAEPVAKPLAWYVPHLLTFKNAERTNCPPELQGELEGQVAWEASLIGDGHPVTDKHGVTHRPIPLYATPQPQAAACICDGAAYAPEQAHPFIVNERCPRHGKAAPQPQAAKEFAGFGNFGEPVYRTAPQPQASPQASAEVRSERRPDGGLYIVVGPYDNPRPHGEAMSFIRASLGVGRE